MRNLLLLLAFATAGCGGAGSTPTQLPLTGAWKGTLGPGTSMPISIEATFLANGKIIGNSTFPGDKAYPLSEKSYWDKTGIRLAVIPGEYRSPTGEVVFANPTEYYGIVSVQPLQVSGRLFYDSGDYSAATGTNVILNQWLDLRKAE